MTFLTVVRKCTSLVDSFLNVEDARDSKASRIIESPAIIFFVICPISDDADDGEFRRIDLCNY